MAAGINAVKLEELERRLRNDLTKESGNWGGRLLLHREVKAEVLRRHRRAQSKHLDLPEEEEDVTQKEDERPDAAVVAFWDSTGQLRLTPCPQINFVVATCSHDPLGTFLLASVISRHGICLTSPACRGDRRH